MTYGPPPDPGDTSARAIARDGRSPVNEREAAWSAIEARQSEAQRHYLQISGRWRSFRSAFLNANKDVRALLVSNTDIATEVAGLARVIELLDLEG